MTPGVAICHVYNDNTGTACTAGVGEISITPFIEANVVGVRVSIAYGWLENDRVDDSVVAQTDTNKFTAAVLAVGEHSRGRINGSAGVDGPQDVVRVDDNGLDTDEVVLVVC